MGFLTPKAPKIETVAPPPIPVEAPPPIAVEEVKESAADDLASRNKRKKGMASTILSEMMGALGNKSKLGGL